MVGKYFKIWLLQLPLAGPGLPLPSLTWTALQRPPNMPPCFHPCPLLPTLSRVLLSNTVRYHHLSDQSPPAPSHLPLSKTKILPHPHLQILSPSPPLTAVPGHSSKAPTCCCPRDIAPPVPSVSCSPPDFCRALLSLPASLHSNVPFSDCHHNSVPSSHYTPFPLLTFIFLPTIPTLLTTVDVSLTDFVYPPQECLPHRGKDVCLFSSLLYPQPLKSKCHVVGAQQAFAEVARPGLMHSGR